MNSFTPSTTLVTQNLSVMKKMLIAIIILLLIVIALLLFCNCKKKCVTCNEPGKPGKPADSCQLVCFDYTDGNLSGMIDLTSLAEMSRRYAEDPSKGYINGTGQRDALSMTFDLEKIKTLIWQIENSVCSNGCDKRQLGIRYYYVKYPETVGTSEAPESLRGIDPSERNRHALVMVPAYWDNENGQWKDFDIWNAGRPDKCYSVFPSPPRVGQDTIRAGLTGMDGDGGDNHGGAGPPPEPGYFTGN
jgi:hypothetical protein